MIVFGTASTPEKQHVFWRKSIEAQGLQAEFRCGPKAVLENLWEFVHTLPPSEIVVWIDADDFALPTLRLAIETAYKRGAWLTYGQFQWKGGQLGFASEWNGQPPRSLPWIFTHVKTFRAGLFHKIEKRDLIKDGEWIEPTDMPVMFPLLELAGPEHTTFIKSPLCVYTGEGGLPNFEWYIRNLPAYTRLTERPW